jgi:acid stress chaperone HdeB
MNTPKIILLGSLLVLLAAAPAGAQVTIDVSKITCEQYLLARVATPEKIAIWLSGYFNGRRANTVLDVKQLEASEKKLTEHCRSNYPMTVLQAAEQIAPK